MAFRGRAATMSFRTPTAGLPTARERHDLADGSVLLLTIAVGVDPTGTIWEDSIPPDETVSSTPRAPKEQVDAAIDASEEQTDPVIVEDDAG
jgi:hypothetical protein